MSQRMLCRWGLSPAALPSFQCGSPWSDIGDCSRQELSKIKHSSDIFGQLKANGKWKDNYHQVTFLMTCDCVYHLLKCCENHLTVFGMKNYQQKILSKKPLNASLSDCSNHILVEQGAAIVGLGSSHFSHPCVDPKSSSANPWSTSQTVLGQKDSWK